MTSGLFAALFAQAAPAPAGQPPAGGSFLLTFLPLILMMVAMWFLLIAPQRKKQKEHQKMVSSLQAGDEVLTQGGLYGTVTNIKDERVTVRLSDSAKAEVSKAYIASVTRKG